MSKKWAYRAKDVRGKVVEGTLNAGDRKEAQRFLRDQKLRPVKLVQHSDSFFSRLLVKDKKGNLHIQLGSGLPTGKELAVFTKQASIMIERGVPLIQALSILANQQKSRVFEDIILQVRTMVENGSALSNSLSVYPKVFDDLYVAMVRSGEVSGNLDVVLKEIVKFLEKSVKLRAQLKSASIYPGMIVFTATVITYGILVFLVPVFTEQYVQAGKALPGPTQIVVDVSNILSHYLPHVIAGFVGGFFMFRRYRKTPEGKLKTDELLLKMPIIGDVVKKVAIGRFTATMATMLSSGVSILDALTICSQSAGNKLIEAFVINVRNKITGGSTFSDPLAEGDLFPNMVVSMVAIGEQTGALDQTLVKISEIYEDEVDSAVKNMTDSLQPILIITIGCILGFVVVALYLPIMDSANLVG